ncbi:hypothetical protein BB560_002688 [Smittium megazygosporum]|uniref:Dol-P-Glc:Glc(2)Man(9)GlcNAc(2)-PP-Dol alpha-1,2-glucosyltransferase n=1 Tax=Smittium megazygosporum TaxID=133381 RepID=A0A2T9ZE37_9FUNG|nr:hypothetical protein BB560_002688 [Smittium megazygosporum]
MDTCMKFAFAVFSALGLIVLLKTNKQVPLPYMDEIFHVSQVQAYCKGNFSHWDPKLTTPPGLYIVSLLFAKVSHLLWISQGDGCSLTFLRSYNYILSLMLFFVVQSLVTSLSPTKSSLYKALTTFTIMIFPVSFFFHFLYYTETISSLFVLYGYKAALDRRYWYSSMILLLSLFMRQTNVVYAAMIMGWSVLQELNFLSGENSANLAINVKAYNTRVLETFIAPFKELYFLSLQHAAYLFKIFSGYMIVFSAFLTFVKANHGVVLVLHFPQMYYFILFLAGSCFPSIARVVVDPIYFFRRNFLRSWRLLIYIITCLFMLYTVKMYTIEHPFVLSDNRHFSFYIWKDIYRKHESIRYLLVPVYFYAGWMCWRAIAKSKSLIWCLTTILGIALTLVPTPLLEFRYFIIPYYIFRLHIDQPSTSRVLVELSINVLVNLSVLYLFFNKTFSWPSEPDAVMRFMW